MKKTKAVATQQAQLRAARKRLKVSNAELARMLGKSEGAILSWLAPKTSGKHRTMPQGSKLLLAAILADAKRK